MNGYRAIDPIDVLRDACAIEIKPGCAPVARGILAVPRLACGRREERRKIVKGSAVQGGTRNDRISSG